VSFRRDLLADGELFKIPSHLVLSSLGLRANRNFTIAGPKPLFVNQKENYTL
jgi:hypothetical protein